MRTVLAGGTYLDPGIGGGLAATPPPEAPAAAPAQAQAVAALEPVVGSTFADHRLDAIAGRGGMAVVYRATDLVLDRTVALKLITPAVAQDPWFRARFDPERRLAATVDHPSVVPIYRGGEEGGHLYLTMRYVEGTDLRDVARPRTAAWSPTRACRDRDAGRRRARRRARARARPPRRQAGERAARRRATAGLPHRLRPRAAPGPRPPTRPGSRGRASPSARRTTWRPSRPRAPRSTAAPTCTRSAACSITRCRVRSRTSSAATWRSCTRTSTSHRPPWWLRGRPAAGDQRCARAHAGQGPARAAPDGGHVRA